MRKSSNGNHGRRGGSKNARSRRGIGPRQANPFRVILGVMLGLVVSGSLIAAMTGGTRGRGAGVGLLGAPILPPASPAREYVYAGGRMLASEQPVANGTPTPTPGTSYEGNVDSATCTSVTGWAADRNRLNVSISISIYDGNKMIGTSLANQLRSDIGTLLGDNGLHGYSIPTPASLMDGSAHTIHLKFEAGSTDLPGSPATLTCTLTTNYEGYVDHAGCDSIYGWAADHNRLNTSINVGVYDGSTLIALVPANLYRSDVASYLGDNGLHAFVINLPAGLMTGTAHTVHLKFEKTTTEMTAGSPASISCTAFTPNYVGFVDSATCTFVQGWAADRNRLNISIAVSLYDGTTLLETVPATNIRADIGAFLGDNGAHGYVLPIPASLSDGASHSLHLKFETSATDLTGSPAALTCPPVPPFASLSLTPPAYVNVPSSSTLNITGKITVEAWINTNSSSQQQGIIERYNSLGSTTSNGGYALRLSSTGQLQFLTLKNGSVFALAQSSAAVTTGVWHHVAGVFNGTQLMVFIDGALAGSTSSTLAPVTGTATLKIGASGDTGSFSFNGLIDEARVTAAVLYSTTFTPTMWARAGSGGTVGLWHFDDHTLFDSSGYGNFGGAVGSVAYSTNVPTF
jgi:hypothetical protein